MLKHLEKSGILLRDEDALRVAGDATVRMANLAVSPEELAEYMSSKSCTPKQRAVLTLLEQTGSASVKELCYFCLLYTSIEEKGRLELPGRPLLYGTTADFLRCFGLQSLEGLPPLPQKEDENAQMDETTLHDVIEQAEIAEN